nr:MAG TPA: chromosome partitioning protein [Caudoviricetes sp.]
MNEKTKIVMLPAECLEHHPENPRKEIGDIAELTDSIKANGILQNLTVVPKPDDEGKYLVVIGNRRYEAGLGAGLTEFPCVISDMDHTKQLETMLIENMNRSDLTVYEQAKGFEQLTIAGYSVNDIAEKTGFSQSTVRRRINLCQYDKEIVTKAFEKQATFEDFEQLNKIKDEESRASVAKFLGSSNFGWYLQQGIKEERKKERETIVLEAIKDIARKAEQDERCWQFDEVCVINLRTNSDDYSGMYDDIEKAKQLPKLDNGEYVYFRDYANNFEICKPQEISEPAPKSDNIDKYKKEREEIESLISDMYARHMDFIKNYDKNPKSVPGIALLCIDTISKLFTTDGLGKVSYVDLDDVTDYISEKHLEIYVENADTLSDYYKSNISRFYVQLTTALLNVKNIYSDLWYRKVNQSIGYSGNGNYTTCSYNRTQEIKIFADFIEHLGYVMSDEEKQLIDGTHRLYHLEDNEEAE